LTAVKQKPLLAVASHRLTGSGLVVYRLVAVFLKTKRRAVGYVCEMILYYHMSI